MVNRGIVAVGAADGVCALAFVPISAATRATTITIAFAFTTVIFLRLLMDRILTTAYLVDR